MLRDYYTVLVNGKEFEACYDKGNAIRIKTKNMALIDGSFEPAADGYYTKMISSDEISEVFIHRVEYFYKGVKVGILGVSGGKCTVFLSDRETAEKLGGFAEMDDRPPAYIKTVDETEVDAVEQNKKSSSHVFCNA